MAEEMVAQILLRLPPKSLIRFKCVQKSWCAQIDSPVFISHHLNIYNKSSSSTPIIFKRYVLDMTESTTEEIVFSLLHLHNDNDGNLHSFIEDITFPPSMGLRARAQFIGPYDFMREPIHIVGHYDGIICLIFHTSDAGKHLVLFNPSLHGFRIVQGSISNGVGFGYDPKTNDYIVLHIQSSGEESIFGMRLVISPPTASIYNMRTDCWREIKTTNLETETTNFWASSFLMYHKGTFFCVGNEQEKEFDSCYDIHEPRYNTPCIIVFDTGDELFHNLMLPESFYDPESGSFNMQISVWHEVIALFGFKCDYSDNNINKMFEIWVMVDFGSTCSWIKHLIFEPMAELYIPLALWKSKIVFSSTGDGRFISYNFDLQKLDYLPVHGVNLEAQAVVCVNSLVSVKERLQIS